MSAANRPPNNSRDLDELVTRIEALERQVASYPPVLAAVDAPLSSLYIDEADGKLYFKDAAGASNLLY